MQDCHGLNETLNVNYEKIYCFEYPITVITIIFSFNLLKKLKNFQRRHNFPAPLGKLGFCLVTVIPGREILWEGGAIKLLTGMPGLVRIFIY